MSSRIDPRVVRLLEKTALENLLKTYFQSVYGKDEIVEMERGLNNALKKYENIEEIFQALWENENVAEPYLKDCLDTLCEESYNAGRNHSPESLMMLSKFFIKVRDWRLAGEILWGATSLAIQNFITERNLNVRLYSHNGKVDFARALSDDIGRRFAVFVSCHSGFYSNNRTARQIISAYEDANEFILLLKEFNLTDEKKLLLEKDNFN
ncbi:unnamed protein product [Auanema sp. JU1783]|nr:unnamed protein product [Auanema sp. JU1783]